MGNWSRKTNVEKPKIWLILSAVSTGVESKEGNKSLHSSLAKSMNAEILKKEM